jgi:hypothetical protein
VGCRLGGRRGLNAERGIMITWKYSDKEVTKEEVKKIIQTCFKFTEEHRTEDCPYFITELGVETDALLEEKNREVNYA